jgi:5-methylcytosine-specific restriction enzyme B
VSQCVFLCLLTFSPQDESYFAIVVRREAGKFNFGLVKLAREIEARNKITSASGRTPSSINNNVKTLRPGMSVGDIAIAPKIVATAAMGV